MFPFRCLSPAYSSRIQMRLTVTERVKYCTSFSFHVYDPPTTFLLDKNPPWVVCLVEKSHALFTHFPQATVEYFFLTYPSSPPLLAFYDLLKRHSSGRIRISPFFRRSGCLHPFFFSFPPLLISMISSLVFSPIRIGGLRQEGSSALVVQPRNIFFPSVPMSLGRLFRGSPEYCVASREGIQEF